MRRGITASTYKEQALGKTATPTLISSYIEKNNPNYPGEAIGIAEIRNNDVESVSLYCDGSELLLPVAPGAITERVLVRRDLTRVELVVVKVSAKAGDREMSSQINVPFYFGDIPPEI